MPKTRIPALTNTSRATALRWMDQMHKKGLLFHPDDRPEDLVKISDGSPTLTSNECKDARRAMLFLFTHHGDAVYEFAFDTLSQTFHTHIERKLITGMAT
jgi:hypothetical protein